MIEYLKENWIALAAIVIAILSWITSIIGRNDTNKLHLEEKRHGLRIFLTDMKIEYSNMLEELNRLIRMNSEDKSIFTSLEERNLITPTLKQPLHDMNSEMIYLDLVVGRIKESLIRIDEIYKKAMNTHDHCTPAEMTEDMGLAEEARHHQLEFRKSIDHLSKSIEKRHDLIKQAIQNLKLS